jgi:hypothetical protein
MALPGRYSLKLSAYGKTYTSEAEVKPDPRSPVSSEQLKQNFAFALEARTALDRLVDDIDAVRAIREQAAEISKRTQKLAAGEGPPPERRRAGQALRGDRARHAQPQGRGGVRRAGRARGRREALFADRAAVSATSSRPTIRRPRASARNSTRTSRSSRSWRASSRACARNELARLEPRPTR